MKKLLYLCLAVAFIFTACKKEDDNSSSTSPYAGNWSGQYQGGEAGIWYGTISAAGALNGFAESNSNETFAATGSVTNNGSFYATFGTTSSGATFQGTLNGNSGSGTWSNSSEGLSGTWSGNKQ